MNARTFKCSSRFIELRAYLPNNLPLLELMLTVVKRGVIIGQMEGGAVGGDGDAVHGGRVAQEDDAGPGDSKSETVWETLNIGHVKGQCQVKAATGL